MNSTIASRPNSRNSLLRRSTQLMALFTSSPSFAPRQLAALKLWTITSRKIIPSRATSNMRMERQPPDPWPLQSKKNLDPHCPHPTSIEPSSCMKANVSTVRNTVICLLTALKSRSLNWRNLNTQRSLTLRTIQKTSSLEASLLFRQKWCWGGGNRSQ